MLSRGVVGCEFIVRTISVGEVVEHLLMLCIGPHLRRAPIRLLLNEIRGLDRLLVVELGLPYLVLLE